MTPTTGRKVRIDWDHDRDHYYFEGDTFDWETPKVDKPGEDRSYEYGDPLLDDPESMDNWDNWD